MKNDKAEITLGMFGDQVGAVQSAFERAAISTMRLRPGLFAIHYEENRYINRNVQWLWKQFQKGEGK